MMDVDCGVDACNGDEAMVTDEDEIEDKQTKRRSSSRVRYGLAVEVNGRGENEWFAV